MELRAVGIHEVDLIERLFQKTYGQEKGIDYWKWSFKNPYGYINTGLLEKNRLIGYYAAHFTKNSACLSLPMVHPNYNLEMLLKQLSKDLLDRISTNRSFVYTFSYDPFTQLLLEEGFVQTYQIKDYFVSINKAPDPINWFESGLYDPYIIWRYRNHPLTKYIFHEKGVFRFFNNIFDNQIHIVDYKDSKDLKELIEVAKQIGYWENKININFWCEEDLSYGYDLIPLWKLYNIFDKNLDIKDIMSLDKTRMGMNYDY